MNTERAEQELKGSRTKGKTLTNNLRDINAKTPETEHKNKLGNYMQSNKHIQQCQTKYAKSVKQQ